MNKEIQWIFFDVGMTLIDETNSYQDFVERCVVSLRQHDLAVCHEGFWQKMKEASCDFKNPLQTALNYYRGELKLPRPIWQVKNECLMPEVKVTLAKLQSSYHLGIIANQVQGLEGCLRKLGIADYFDLILSSSDCAYHKPQPEIFQLALKQAQAKAENCVYVGDRCDNDIIPAKKLGFTTIRMLYGLAALQAENPDFPSDFQITKLTQIMDVLMRK
ncbi:HAD family hydrolase [Streptococcus massiliensis]|uniref:HAD superfamily hydrolase n=1 Tax=Streptococcus massiliensis TaxID=313439 RepID=A0A380KY44_9STRE|nr:HAD family hydrolase [Streptococcus massiliensis]SUN76064.1 HAD superfamily hydrolase [Streptococcus massiliensis]